MNNSSKNSNQNFNYENWKNFLFYFWLYTLIVILWGAWVRISHSGNGCGDHWPLCSGEFIPDLTQKKTWIEYTHRLMSGSYGLLVIFIFFKIRKMIQVNTTTHTSNLNSNLTSNLTSNWLKRLNYALFILMIIEALLGALLVKAKLVTENDTLLRLVVMSIHQINSFLLTGCTFSMYLIFKNKSDLKAIASNFYLLALFLIIPATGAIASLSTTLFPTLSLWQGIIQDFSQNSHIYIKLRILHPVFAIFIVSIIYYYSALKEKSFFTFELLFIVTIGIITLLSHSPVYLKLLHLFLAHYLWGRLIQLFVNFPDSSNR